MPDIDHTDLWDIQAGTHQPMRWEACRPFGVCLKQSMKNLQSLPVKSLLAICSGGIGSLAYPPLGWGWLIFPALAMLLIVLDGERGTRARALGFFFGMAFFGTGLSWLWQIFGSMAVVLWMVLSAFPALFAEMQTQAASRGLAGWKFATFTALNWSAWEFIRAELFPLKFPWMTAGLAIGPNALLPWIGVYGVGLVISIGIAFAIRKQWLVALPVFLGLALAVGKFSKHPQPATEDPNAITVGGLQFENVTLDEFLKESRKLPAEAKHVVWPEYAIPYDIRSNLRDWRLIQELCKERNVTLTFGTQQHVKAPEGWGNIALTVDANGTRGQHTKVHTVHFFDDGKPGTDALPVETAHGKVGTPVCFDCDYEGVTRRMTASGAETFMVPIMDAEKWTARQHDQHAELYRIRASENGRWMFVSASSGISQVIDPNGQVHARLDALRQGPITGIIRRETKLTFYTRYGWTTPWIALTATIIIMLTILFRNPDHDPELQPSVQE